MADETEDNEHKDADGEYVCCYCDTRFQKDETLVVVGDGPAHIACLAKHEREEEGNG